MQAGQRARTAEAAIDKVRNGERRFTEERIGNLQEIVATERRFTQATLERAQESRERAVRAEEALNTARAEANENLKRARVEADENLNKTRVREREWQALLRAAKAARCSPIQITEDPPMG